MLIKSEIQELREKLNSAIELIQTVIYGKADIVLYLFVALLAEGHVLLDDVPGIGKTTLVKAFAKVTGMSFKRVQGTPDLLPSDIIGMTVLNPRNQEFEFRQGPIFTNLLLFDEINRVTPKTQSALLEAMEERQVTVEGRTMSLPKPFMVIATQNPLEFVGIYPLVESQLDRFLLRLKMGYPDKEAELKVLQVYRAQRLDDPYSKLKPIISPEELYRWQSAAQEVRIHPELIEYVRKLLVATREHPDIMLPLSPRAGLAILKASSALALIRGRDYVIPEDIVELIPHVFPHRIFTGNIYDPDKNKLLLDEIVKTVPVPS